MISTIDRSILIYRLLEFSHVPRIFSGTVFSSREGVTLPENGSGITVGNFDGVHLGHREIVARLVSLAQPLGLPSVALTFDPHPAELLHPSLARRFLTTYNIEQSSRFLLV